MYIALEGVKGVGKSTLFEKLCIHYRDLGLDFCELAPTRPSDKGSFWEQIVQKWPSILNSGIVREIFYAWRSNRAVKGRNFNAKHILGDRSVATSYVTRMWRYSTTQKQINRVDFLHKLIPAPDYILFLDADPSTILARIASRKNRTYGKADEQHDKLVKDIDAYRYLMKYSPAARLGHTKWIVIDANQDADAVFSDALLKINEILKINQ